MKGPMEAVKRLIRTAMTGAMLVAVLVTLSSCGGSSGEASASQPLTKAQFIKRADAICRSEESRKTKALTEASKRGKNYLSGSHQELAHLVSEAILPLYSEMIEELAALNPPAADRAKMEQLIAKYEKTLENAEANPGRQVVYDAFIPVNRAAMKYGFKECTL